jgi:hypothetical protein
MSSLAAIATTKSVLDILVGGAFIAAFLGVYVICRSHEGGRSGPPGAFVASVVYAGSPFYLNEFVAGHVLNLVGYSLLPALSLLALSVEKESKERVFLGRAIFAGLVVGFSAVQIQYLAFDALLLVLLSITSRRPVKLAAFATIAVLVGAAAQSFSLANLLLPSATGVELPARSSLEWFGDMSVQPRLGLLGYGYVVDYARSSIAWDMDATVWQVVGFAALVPIVVTLSVRRAARWPLVCLVGVFLSSGVLGPGAGLKMWLFGHVPAASLVRELYNLSSLTTLGMALCLGLTVDWLVEGPKKSKALVYRLPVGIATAFTVIVAVLPFYQRSTLDLLYLWKPSQSYEQLGEVFARDPLSRIEFLPAAQPLHSDGSRDGKIFSFAGGDMWNYEFRHHPVASEYSPSGIVAIGLSALGHEDYDFAARVFGLFGVRYFVARHDVRSYAPRFWFPKLFPMTWERGSALASADDRAKALRKILANRDFDVYENLEYHPIVTLAQRRLTCDRSQVFGAAFGDASGCEAVSAATPVASFLPAPDEDTYTPEVGWVSAQPFYMISEAMAEHWQSIFTNSSRPHLFRLEVSQRVALFASCQAAGTAAAVVDGDEHVLFGCEPIGSRTDKWHKVATLGEGSHSVVIEKPPGPMILNRLIAYPEAKVPSEVIDPVLVAQVTSQRPPVKAAVGVLSFARTASDRFTGSVMCPKECTLVMVETFNRNWKLRVDNGQPMPATMINLTQNGFEVPAGAHRFSLKFELSPVSGVALFVQNYSWIVSAIVVVFLYVKSAPASLRGASKYARRLADSATAGTNAK